MKYISILIIGFLLSACELDRVSLSNVADDNYWTSSKDFEVGINGVYDALQNDYLYGGGVAGDNYEAKMTFRDHDMISDNSYNRWEWMGGALYMTGQIDPTHFLFSSYWAANYTLIGRANAMKQRIEESTILSEEESRLYLAQAQAMGALGYYNLATLFGNVPLVTSMDVSDGFDDLSVPASESEDFIFDFVEQQFNSADSLLNLNNSLQIPTNWINSYGIKALLARAYMFRAKFNDAEPLLRDIESGPYSLHPDYEELFSYEGEASNEVIFSIRFMSLSGGNNGEGFSGTYAQECQGHHHIMPNLVDEFYDTTGVSNKIFNTFDKNDSASFIAHLSKYDPRMDASILFPGELWYDGATSGYQPANGTNYRIQKYIRRDQGDVGSGGQDFYLVRYAEVLLSLAECIIENDGNQTEAEALINRVRNRPSVMMPNVTSTEINNTRNGIRGVMRHERRVETALEGLRFYDLKRWHMNDNDGVIGEFDLFTIEADNVSGYQPDFTLTERLYWPFPQDAIDNNTLLQQNQWWN